MQNSARFLLIGVVLSLTACAAAVVGTAAVTAVDVAYDRRTFGNYIDDNSVELKIRKDIIADPNLRGDVNISVTSMNGIVLLTGETPTEEQRNTAMQYAQGYDEVKQVVNEIQIAGKSNLPSRTNDSWITTKVKTQLYRAANLNANRVKVVTERGTVYLMGLVTSGEADAAVESARTVRGVARIVKVFEYLS